MHIDSIGEQSRLSILEDAIMERARIHDLLERPQYQPRKILLDCDVYCPHSMRESDGDADCDHDFEMEPDVAQASYAIWNCTLCGRAVRFDVWV